MAGGATEPGSANRFVLRNDHVAGGVFIAGSAVLLAASGDLPFGTLASPGAGMMPTLVLVLMMGLGAMLVVGAKESPPLADIAWNDLKHAITIIVAAAAATALYTVLGFIVSIGLLLFTLIYIVERANIWRALAISLGTTTATYWIFSTLLKSPLPSMPQWF
jgi:FtsH-binding integral membrane protein